MKKLIFLLVMFLMTACVSKNKSEDVLYFENPSYVECNIPVIKTYLDSTEVSFILDTGANNSLIDSDWYSKHQELFTFSRTVEIQYHGINGSTEIEEVDVVVGKLAIGNVTFMESNLSAIKEQLHAQGYDVIGIIGSDFFERNMTVIDYGNRALYFVDLKLDSLNLIKK